MIFSESRFRGNAKPKNEIHTIRFLFLYGKFYSIPYAINIAQSTAKLSAAKVTN